MSRRSVLLATLLAVTTLAAYARVRGHAFVNYDDPAYVTENAVVRAGLTVDGVTWAFSANHSSNWHPLTWLAHMLDVQLFELDASGHHLTSLLLHAFNAVLCFAVFASATRRMAPSFLVAALFALHPLRVESVAWVAERKDVLSGTFFFLTLLLYVRYARGPNGARYAAVAVAFLLGLMAKPMLVTLPFVLLLMDAWPLERSAPWSRRLLEKLPLLALAATSCVVTVWAQRAGGAVGSLERLALDERIWNALRSYGVYLWQSVWPVGLACFYPHPALLSGGVNLIAQALVSGLFLLGVTCLVLRRQRAPVNLPVPVTIGWLWFLGMLLPVIGLVQVGSQAHADRYTYLPLVGIHVALVFGAAELARAREAWRKPLLALAALALVAFAALTWYQSGVWRDSETLNRHALAVTESNFVAHNNLGLVVLERGDVAAATGEFQRAVELNPAFFEARVNLGLALEATDRVEDARDQFEAAHDLRPEDPAALAKLAEACTLVGRSRLRAGSDAAAGESLERAAALYERLLERHGDGPWASSAARNLEWIRGRMRELE